MSREFKRGRSDEQGQPMFNKRALNQDSLSAPKVIKERGCGSLFSKPTCTTCGKRHCTKCLFDTNGCYGCGKNDQKVRDCPTLVAWGRESKQVTHDGPNLDDQKKNFFYVLHAKKEANTNECVGKSQFLVLMMRSLYVDS